eukprot:jgi/Mesen1/1029/ME000121S00099
MTGVTSAAELLQQAEALSYTERVTLAAQLGRAQRDNPALIALIAELTQHSPSPSLGICLKSSGLQMLAGPQETSTAANFLSHHLGLTAAAASGRHLAVLEKALADPSQRFKPLVCKAVAAQTQSDAALWGLIWESPETVRRSLLATAVRQRRVALLERCVERFVAEEGDATSAAKLLHGCGGAMVERHLGALKMHPALHWRKLARFHGAAILALLKQELQVAAGQAGNGAAGGASEAAGIGGGGNDAAGTGGCGVAAGTGGGSEASCTGSDGAEAGAGDVSSSNTREAGSQARMDAVNAVWASWGALLEGEGEAELLSTRDSWRRTEDLLQLLQEHPPKELVEVTTPTPHNFGTLYASSLWHGVSSSSSSNLHRQVALFPALVSRNFAALLQKAPRHFLAAARALCAQPLPHTVQFHATTWINPLVVCAASNRHVPSALILELLSALLDGITPVAFHAEALVGSASEFFNNLASWLTGGGGGGGGNGRAAAWGPASEDLRQLARLLAAFLERVRPTEEVFEALAEMHQLGGRQVERREEAARRMADKWLAVVDDVAHLVLASEACRHPAAPRRRGEIKPALGCPASVKEMEAAWGWFFDLAVDTITGQSWADTTAFESLGRRPPLPAGDDMPTPPFFRRVVPGLLTLDPYWDVARWAAIWRGLREPLARLVERGELAPQLALHVYESLMKAGSAYDTSWHEYAARRSAGGEKGSGGGGSGSATAAAAGGGGAGSGEEQRKEEEEEEEEEEEWREEYRRARASLRALRDEVFAHWWREFEGQDSDNDHDGDSDGRSREHWPRMFARASAAARARSLAGLSDARLNALVRNRDKGLYWCVCLLGGAARQLMVARMLRCRDLPQAASNEILTLSDVAGVGVRDGLERAASAPSVAQRQRMMECVVKSTLLSRSAAEALTTLRWLAGKAKSARAEVRAFILNDLLFTSRDRFLALTCLPEEEEDEEQVGEESNGRLNSGGGGDDGVGGGRGVGQRAVTPETGGIAPGRGAGSGAGGVEQRGPEMGREVAGGEQGEQGEEEEEERVRARTSEAQCFSATWQQMLRNVLACPDPGEAHALTPQFVALGSCILGRVVRHGQIERRRRRRRSKETGGGGGSGGGSGLEGAAAGVWWDLGVALQWQVYVYDRGIQAAGSPEGGFQIQIQTQAHTPPRLPWDLLASSRYDNDRSYYDNDAVFYDSDNNDIFGNNNNDDDGGGSGRGRGVGGNDDCGDSRVAQARVVVGRLLASYEALMLEARAAEAAAVEGGEEHPPPLDRLSCERLQSLLAVVPRATWPLVPALTEALSAKLALWVTQSYVDSHGVTVVPTDADRPGASEEVREAQAAYALLQRFLRDLMQEGRRRMQGHEKEEAEEEGRLGRSGGGYGGNAARVLVGVPLMVRFVEALAASQLAPAHVGLWWALQMAQGEAARWPARRARLAAADKLLALSPSAVHANCVWRTLLRYRQQSLTPFLEAKEAPPGPFRISWASLASSSSSSTQRKKKKKKKSAPNRTRGAASGRSARMSGPPPRAVKRMAPRKQMFMAYEPDLGGGGGPKRMPGLSGGEAPAKFLVPASWGLHRLTPQQCGAMVQYMLASLRNENLPVVLRTGLARQLTCLPTFTPQTLIAALVAFGADSVEAPGGAAGLAGHAGSYLTDESDFEVVDDEEEAEEEEKEEQQLEQESGGDTGRRESAGEPSGRTSSPPNENVPAGARTEKVPVVLEDFVPGAPGAVLETLVRGWGRIDEPLAAISMLAAPPFLLSFGQEATAVLRHCVRFMRSPGDVYGILEDLLHGTRRRSLKVNVHKEIVRVLAGSGQLHSAELLLREWRRMRLHRDVRVAVLQSAARMLAGPQSQALAPTLTRIFDVTSVPTGPGRVGVLVAYLSVVPQGSHSSSLQQRLREWPALDCTDELVALESQLAEIPRLELPLDLCPSFFQLAVAPLCTKSPGVPWEVHVLAMCRLRRWASEACWRADAAMARQVVRLLRAEAEDLSPETAASPVRGVMEANDEVCQRCMRELIDLSGLALGLIASLCGAVKAPSLASRRVRAQAYERLVFVLAILPPPPVQGLQAAAGDGAPLLALAIALVERHRLAMEATRQLWPLCWEESWEARARALECLHRLGHAPALFPALLEATFQDLVLSWEQHGTGRPSALARSLVRPIMAWRPPERLASVRRLLSWLLEAGDARNTPSGEEQHAVAPPGGVLHGSSKQGPEEVDRGAVQGSSAQGSEGVQEVGAGGLQRQLLRLELLEECCAWVGLEAADFRESSGVVAHALGQARTAATWQVTQGFYEAAERLSVRMKALFVAWKAKLQDSTVEEEAYHQNSPAVLLSAWIGEYSALPPWPEGPPDSGGGPAVREADITFLHTFVAQLFDGDRVRTTDIVRPPQVVPLVNALLSRGLAPSGAAGEYTSGYGAWLCISSTVSVLSQILKGAPPPATGGAGGGQDTQPWQGTLQPALAVVLQSASAEYGAWCTRIGADVEGGGGPVGEVRVRESTARGAAAASSFSSGGGMPAQSAARRWLRLAAHQEVGLRVLQLFPGFAVESGGREARLLLWEALAAACQRAAAQEAWVARPEEEAVAGAVKRASEVLVDLVAELHKGRSDLLSSAQQARLWVEEFIKPSFPGAVEGGSAKWNVLLRVAGLRVALTVLPKVDCLFLRPGKTEERKDWVQAKDWPAHYLELLDEIGAAEGIDPLTAWHARLTCK